MREWNSACVSGCLRIFDVGNRTEWQRKKKTTGAHCNTFLLLSSVGLARSLSLPFQSLSLALLCLSCRHADYADSAYIYVGGLDGRLTEGDVITIFSQVCLCARVCCVLGEFTYLKTLPADIISVPCFLPSSLPPSNSLPPSLPPSLPSLHLFFPLSLARSLSMSDSHTNTTTL